MTPRTLVLAGCLLTVAGCGPRKETLEEVELTSSNAVSLLATVWADNVSTEPSDVLLEAEPLLDKHLPLLALQPNGATIDVPCKVSGVISLTGQIADAARPGWTIGDRVTATWNACRDEAGEYGDVSSGKTTLEITGVALGSQTFTLTYESFGTSLATFGTFTTSGTLTITRAKDGAVTTVAVSAEKLTGSGLGVEETVENKQIKLVDYGSRPDAAFSLEFSATATSSRWGGRRLAYETPVAFTGAGDEFPAKGQLLLHGAKDASARMTAIDTTSVRIELDLDGDGAIDQGTSSTMSWFDLDELETGGGQ